MARTLPVSTGTRDLDGAPLGRLFFRDERMAWLWLVVRVFLGYEWLTAGIAKFGAPAWTGANAGAAVAGFVHGALQKTQGAHPDVTGWYAGFLSNFVLPNAGAVAYMVTYGEILIGIGLIAGGLTAIAAFFGALMNVSYLMAGTVSTNAWMLVLAIALMLAWRTAGSIGLDRYLLPRLGTPWQGRTKPAPGAG